MTPTNDLSPSSASSHNLHLNFAAVFLLAAFATFLTLLSCLCCYRCMHSWRTSSSSSSSNDSNSNLMSSGDGRQKLEILDKLPVFEFSVSTKEGEKEMECAICHGEVEEGERCRLLPRCNHWFHKDCIDMWLDKRLSCPLCRDMIVVSEQC